MDTKALRQKILDLAIRGKLVPQDPNDEPASVLLERIRAEKQQMVKDGKLKAKDIKGDTIIFKGEDNLHYEKFQDGTVKCIEDEIPFELPEGWEWCRLNQIGDWASGATPSRTNNEFYNGNIPWLKTGDLNDSYVVSVPEYVSPLALEKTSIRLNPIGTVLIAMYGATIGKVGILSIEATTNQACCACIPILVHNKYIFYYLMSHKENFISKAEGGAQPNISKEKIVNTLIPIPPQNEQYRITSAIDANLDLVDSIKYNITDISDLIAKTKSKILDLAIHGKLVPQDPNDEPASALLERIRSEKEALIKQGKIKRDKKESIIFRGDDNSYYEKFFDGKGRCIDEELPFESPNGWEWCNLSMIGTTNIGLTYRTTDIIDDGTIVLRSSNIVNDEIDLDDLVRVETKMRENQYVQPNDILICARNGSKALVGKCALIGNMEEPASFGAFMAVYRTDYYKYVVHYLRSNLCRSVFHDSNSTAINQLTQDMLKRAVIPFPPYEEQQRIVKLIDKLLLQLKDIEKSLS